MRTKRLINFLFPAFLLITFSALLASGYFTSRAWHRFYYRQLVSQLEARANIINWLAKDIFSQDSTAALEKLCKSLSELSRTRITFILPDGRVIADSDEDPASMENHSSRPEIMQALAGKTGISDRLSTTLKQKMFYLAIPCGEKAPPSGVIRLSVPVEDISRALKEVYIIELISGAVIALLAATISYFAASSISRAVKKIRDHAAKFAKGDFSHKIAIPKFDELVSLAETLNSMAFQLEERINLITSHRNELEAVFSAMSEGIIVADNFKRVIRMNRTAVDFFDLGSNFIPGRAAVYTFKNQDFLKFLDRSLYSSTPVEDQLILRNGSLYLQMQGVNITGGDGVQIGALIVLTDVTQIRRLEKIRKDFVANVSHELKTPITSIQGFVDTMLDRPIEDAKDMRRFLKIVAKNVHRMNTIIEDLLLLSKIEQEENYDHFPVEIINLQDVLVITLKNIEEKAREKNIEVLLDCPGNIFLSLNVPLFEQAVFNLIDNAINYSQPGSVVKVGVISDSSEITIKIKDQGCGIEEKHIPRLFERFYRVDKNRSRKEGGTGLGLAIVKHIASLHKGRVSVSSVFGQGSEFRIHLPTSLSR